jgi:hypothetical protein
MAISLVCPSARQVSFSLHPQTLGGVGSYQLIVTYALGQTDKAGGWQDILVGGAPQKLTTTIQQGAAMPTPQQVAALIKADAQATFGGSLTSVSIDGTSY